MASYHHLSFYFKSNGVDWLKILKKLGLVWWHYYDVYRHQILESQSQKPKVSSEIVGGISRKRTPAQVLRNMIILFVDN